MTSVNIETPLGLMLAIADEECLLELDFVESRREDGKKTTPILSIEQELHEYFSGRLKHFRTPIAMRGTSFQKRVWQELQKIPCGETRSYSDIAKSIQRPTAFRAVARANATNKLAIIIPCHRVIQADGNIGGYAGGIDKKKWLLAHETKHG